LKPAKYWVKKEEGVVQCLLCPHQCTIKPGKEGICKNKKNIEGELYAHRYGEVSAIALDPIEKKPLYHFYPGSQILSIGTVGCNFQCKFCQNYHLVEATVPTEEVEIEELISSAKRHRSVGIAYTYNEPFISFEFVLDCAVRAREAGLKNVLVTNGYYNPEPFEELLPYIDAMNIDLKSLQDDFYRRLCGGRLEPVLKTIERAHQDCLVELTNLLVTDENDSDEDIQKLVDWIASLDPEIPLHFSRYHPMYKFTNPPTPIERVGTGLSDWQGKAQMGVSGKCLGRAGSGFVLSELRSPFSEKKGLCGAGGGFRGESVREV